MNPLKDQDQDFAQCCLHRQSKPRRSRQRHLHESSLSMGNVVPCYKTTHSQSFSGRAADGRPLIFRLRDPSFPSLHQSQLDLRDGVTATHTPLQTHTGEVHGPKPINVRTDSNEKNWALHRSGQGVREITNPQSPTEYQTTYSREHTNLVSGDSSLQSFGKPIKWHRHDILTGEQKPPVGSRRSWTRTRDEQLLPARRWETDCTALRLH